MRVPFLLAISLFAVACSNAPQVAQQTNNNSNRPMRSEQMQNVTAHTTENQPPKDSNSNSGKWSASGDAIDTAKFDGVIAEGEKALKAKPEDPAAKTALAEAYFDRGFALTNARQYAAAIGDYRRALKHDPNHDESKKWIAQIEGIYKMLKKEAPREGEEPAALPFKK